MQRAINASPDGGIRSAENPTGTRRSSTATVQQLPVARNGGCYVEPGVGVDRSRAWEKHRESRLSSSWLPSSFQPGFSGLPVLSSRWIPLIVLHSLAIPSHPLATIPIPHRAEAQREVSTPNHSHPPHPTRTKPIPVRAPYPPRVAVATPTHSTIMMAIRPSERISGNSLAFLSAAGAAVADATNTGRPVVLALMAAV